MSVLVGLVAVKAALATETGRENGMNPPSPKVRTQVRDLCGRLPLHFEANQGQWGEGVKFFARGKGYRVYLTPEGVVVSLNTPSESSEAKRVLVRVKFLGANREPEMVGEQPLKSSSNYFIGNDPAKWRSGISHYGKVRYRAIYPGVDAIFYGNPQDLEYDFVVSAGVKVDGIRLSYEGVEKMELDGEGNLALTVGGGTLVQQLPRIYQGKDGARSVIPGRYVLLGENVVGFELGAYDARRPVVIDPVLRYSSFLGGGGIDFGEGIAVDDQGFAYVTGTMLSNAFPTTAGAFDQTRNGNGQDVFVTKVNVNGNQLVYSTLLGGSSDDRGLGIAVDPGGNACVTGLTFSNDFPTTAAAFDTTFNGGGDFFVTKLNSTGSSLVYSTFLGGSSFDSGSGIAVDTQGIVYVAGITESTDFPTTMNALQQAFGGGNQDGTVTVLNAAGTDLLYSTFLGGNGLDFGLDIALDNSRNVFVTGPTQSTNFPITDGAFQTLLNQTGQALGGDAFITKLDPFASGQASLLYSTFLGGASGDGGRGIAVDAFGTAYVTGDTNSNNFPVSFNAFQPQFRGGTSDAFVTRLDPQGNGQLDLVYSSFLGGNNLDRGFDIAVGFDGDAYVTGDTNSADFPLVNPLLGEDQVQDQDAFIAKVNELGTTLEFSTYLGGSNLEKAEIAVLAPGTIVVAGTTPSTDFPTTSGSFQKTIGGGFPGVHDAFGAMIVEPELLVAVPNRVPFEGGRKVRFFGQNLDLLDQLTIGDTEVDFEIISKNEIQFTAPGHPPGFAPIFAVFDGQFIFLEGDGLLYVERVKRTRTIPGGKTANDFLMLGVPLAGGLNGADIVGQVRSQLNFADPSVARIFRFNGVNYEDGDAIQLDQNDDIAEGMGFWVISKDTVNLTLIGGDLNQLPDGQVNTLTPQEGIDFILGELEVPMILHPGWNQVSPSLIGGTVPIEAAFLSDGINIFQVVHPDNVFTNQDFFEFTSYASAPYRVATELNSADAYWIFNYTKKGLLLYFSSNEDEVISTALLPPLVSDANFSDGATNVVTRRARAERLSPPPPPSAINSQSPEGGNSGGGCFIATAAYGSPLDRRIGALRVLRDEAIRPSQLGESFVATYYFNSPAAASFLKSCAASRALARRLLQPLVHTVER